MSDDIRSLAVKRSYNVSPQPPTSIVLRDASGNEVAMPEIITPYPATTPTTGGTTQSTVEKPIAPVAKQTRPTIFTAAYAREAAMSMVPILGTIRYAQYAKKDGFTAGEIGWIIGSAALDLLCIIPIVRIGTGVGVSTVRAARVGSAATRAASVTAKTTRIASTTARTTRTIGPTARTGNTQLKLVNNLRTAIESGQAGKIRVAATRLENFGKTASVRKIAGGVDIPKKAAYIRENANVFAKTKIPTNIKGTLNRLDDAFAPYRESRQRLLHPKGAPEAAKAQPGKRVTATVPITREEARGFGLSSRQVDDIFKSVGENRAAYLREAEAIKRANLKKAFDEINEMITKTKRPAPSKSPSTPRSSPKARSTWEPEPYLTETHKKIRYIKTAAEQAEREARRAALNKLRASGALNPKVGVPASKWKPFKLGVISKQRMNQLVSQWNKMGANLAVRQMIVARLLTPAIAHDAAAISRILDAASTKTRSKAMEQLSPEVRNALQNNLVQAAKIAQAESIATAEEIARTEALARVAALTETLAQLSTRAQVWAEAGVSTEALAELATQTRTAIEVATKVATAGTGKIKLTPKESFKKRLVLKPLLSPGDAYKKLSTFQKKGAVAWKQGFIYKLIYPPYGQDNIINSRKPIAGVKMVSGARSAYESIIKARGKGDSLPARITRDMGIMDIRIATPEQGRGKPRLQFKRDVKQRTKTTPAGISGMRR